MVSFYYYMFHINILKKWKYNFLLSHTHKIDGMAKETQDTHTKRQQQRLNEKKKKWTRENELNERFWMKIYNAITAEYPIAIAHDWNSSQSISLRKSNNVKKNYNKYIYTGNYKSFESEIWTLFSRSRSVSFSVVRWMPNENNAQTEQERKLRIKKKREIVVQYNVINRKTKKKNEKRNKHQAVRHRYCNCKRQDN